MSVIILGAVPLHFAGGGGCEQVNPSLSEESPAFPDVRKNAGTIEQIYCIKTEETGLIEQIENARPMEQIYCIKTEDAGPIEQRYSVVTGDAVPMEQRYSIKTEEEDAFVGKGHQSLQTENAASVGQEHHSLQAEDVSSSEEDATMGGRSLESNFKMPAEVCVSLITDLSVKYFLVYIT